MKLLSGCSQRLREGQNCVSPFGCVQLHDRYSTALEKNACSSGDPTILPPAQTRVETEPPSSYQVLPGIFPCASALSNARLARRSLAIIRGECHRGNVVEK